MAIFRTNIRAGARGGGYYRYLARYTKRNRQLLVLGGLFLLGTVLGTLLINSADYETLSALERMLGGFVEQHRDAGLYRSFLSSLGGPMIFWGILFVCGFCAISHPVILLAPLLRGLGFGFSAASLFAKNGMSAVGFVGVLMLPGMLITTVALLLCCRESLRLATYFFRAMTHPSERGEERGPVRLFLARYLTAAGICVLSAFFEAVLCILFANSLFLG